MTISADLTWFGWFYLVMAVAGSLQAIAQIGKRREPRTPTDVVVLILVQAFFVWGIFFVGPTR